MLSSPPLPFILSIPPLFLSVSPCFPSKFSYSDHEINLTEARISRVNSWLHSWCAVTTARSAHPASLTAFFTLQSVCGHISSYLKQHCCHPTVDECGSYDVHGSQHQGTPGVGSTRYISIIKINNSSWWVAFTAVHYWQEKRSYFWVLTHILFVSESRHFHPRPALGSLGLQINVSS